MHASVADASHQPRAPFDGIGVFALAPIAKGTAVWRFAKGLDMEFGPEIVDTLPVACADVLHALRLSRPQHAARSILCFDDARFVNHSDTPNVATDYAQDPVRSRRRAARHRGRARNLTMDYAGFEDQASMEA